MAPAKHRHVPVRMCVVCRKRLPKAELLRHVRSPQGEWTPDVSGTRAGRGCWLCAEPACRERFAAYGVEPRKKRRGNR